MAEPYEPTPSPDQAVVEDGEKKLKYLDFVQVAALYAVVCCSALYEFAKENSGPLRPGVQTVEGTVKPVIGPVYEKFHNVPSDLLKFVDWKVDESITALDHHVPALLKQLSRQAWIAVQRAPAVARELSLEVQQAGLVDTASTIAKSAYIEYEPLAEQYAVTAWRTLNGLPLFSLAAHIMVPTAAYWAEKYNQAAAYAAERGYAAACYLPLVPIDRIAKVFGADGEPVSSTDKEPVSSANVESDGSDNNELAVSTNSEPTGSTNGEPSAVVNGEPDGSANSEPAASTKGEPTASTNGKPDSSANGEPAAPNNGEPTANGEPAVQTDSKPVSSTNGEPDASANGEPAAQSNGEPDASANGEPAAQTNGEPVSSKNGEPDASANGEPTPTNVEPTTSSSGEPDSSTNGEPVAVS